MGGIFLTVFSHFLQKAVVHVIVRNALAFVKDLSPSRRHSSLPSVLCE